MNNEFKKIIYNNQTVYVLENASSGGTSSSSIASNTAAVGGVQKHRPKDSIIVQSYEKKIPAEKPRNFVAKNAKMGGAGAHKDKKKAEKQGDVKHKKSFDMVEAFQNDESNLFYIYDKASGRLKQRMIQNLDEPKAHSMGYRDSVDGALKIAGIIRSKFDPKKFVQNQGGKWVQVHPFGEQGMEKEGYGNHPSQRVDPRTGKKYVPPKSPLGQGVDSDEELSEAEKAMDKLAKGQRVNPGDLSQSGSPLTIDQAQELNAKKAQQTPINITQAQWDKAVRDGGLYYAQELDNYEAGKNRHRDFNQQYDKDQRAKISGDYSQQDTGASKVDMLGRSRPTPMAFDNLGRPMNQTNPAQAQQAYGTQNRPAQPQSATNTSTQPSTGTSNSAPSPEDVINPKYTPGPIPNGFTQINLIRPGTDPQIRYVHKSQLQSWLQNGWRQGVAEGLNNKLKEGARPIGGIMTDLQSKTVKDPATGGFISADDFFAKYPDKNKQAWETALAAMFDPAKAKASAAATTAAYDKKYRDFSWMTPEEKAQYDKLHAAELGQGLKTDTKKYSAEKYLKQLFQKKMDAKKAAAMLKVHWAPLKQLEAFLQGKVNNKIELSAYLAPNPESLGKQRWGGGSNPTVGIVLDGHITIGGRGDLGSDQYKMTAGQRGQQKYVSRPGQIDPTLSMDTSVHHEVLVDNWKIKEIVLPADIPLEIDSLVQQYKIPVRRLGNPQGVAEGEYNPDTFVGKKGTYKGYGITQEGPSQWGISSSLRKFTTLAAAKRHIDKHMEEGVAEGSISDLLNKDPKSPKFNDHSAPRKTKHSGSTPTPYEQGRLDAHRKKSYNNIHNTEQDAEDYKTGYRHVKSRQGVAESYPKHQDLRGVSTDKLKAYLAKQGQQQTSGEGNQVKRVRAELQRREELNFGNIDDEEENQWWIDYDMKEGVAEEGYGNDPSQRVDPRTGKKYVPPKSPLGQGVAEGKKENKHDLIPVKLLKRNVPYWLTYDFYDHGGEMVKLSGPHPTNNNYIIVKDQDGNKYNVSKNAVLFTSDPTQNKGDHQGVAEEWSKKYKSSINCSHPKGFSQKAHCAGKKKHTESMMTMEATCPDCGMCQIHGNLNEIAKGAKDSNGYTKCWHGKHAEGTKKGKNGGQVRNCVPNEGVAEDHSTSTGGWGQGAYAGATGSSKWNGAGHDDSVHENPDWYNDEANSMTTSQLKSLYKHATKLRQAVKQMQAQGDTLEPWQQSKVTKAADYLDAVFQAVDDDHDMGEDTYMAELQAKLDEKIPKNAPVDVWIDDFAKAAKTPNAKGHHQFKNKNPEKIRQMAIAASYGAKNPSKKKK